MFLRSARHMAIPGISTNDLERFIVHADEKLTAFLELERITHELAVSALLGDGSDCRSFRTSERKKDEKL